MAQFPNVNGSVGFKGKTHTNLVISEGNAPAEDLIISRTNGAEPFIYQFGPEGNQTVVLAKGKIAEAAGTEYDTETGYFKSAVRQATDASEMVLGVNHHNVYSRRRDGMVSTLTKPTLITRNFVEVPLFETEGAVDGAAAPTLEAAQVLAEAMKFGAAVSEKGEAALALQMGDRVVADRAGNFRKYVKGVDAPEAVVGQVWGKETDLPPAGFLQYYQEMVNPQMDEFLKQMSYDKSPGIAAAGDAAYPYGAPYTVKGWKPEFEKMLGNKGITGIPFLTDGFFRAQELRTFNVAAAGALDANVEAVRGADQGTNLDMAENKVVVDAGVRNAAVFIKLKHKIDTTKLADVAAQVGGKAVNADDLHVNVTNNTVVIYLPMNETDAPVEHTGLSLTVPMVVDPVAGIPTAWDHKGSVGAVRILLQK